MEFLNWVGIVGCYSVFIFCYWLKVVSILGFICGDVEWKLIFIEELRVRKSFKLIEVSILILLYVKVFVFLFIKKFEKGGVRF